MSNPFHPDWDEIIPDMQTHLREYGVSVEFLDDYDHAIAYYEPGVMGQIVLHNGGTLIAEGEPFYQPPENADPTYEVTE